MGGWRLARSKPVRASAKLRQMGENVNNMLKANVPTDALYIILATSLYVWSFSNKKDFLNRIWF